MNTHTITRRVVLYRNGVALHFDVSVDLQKVAETIGAKAERNKSHIAKECGGAVKVDYIA